MLPNLTKFVQVLAGKKVRLGLGKGPDPSWLVSGRDQIYRRRTEGAKSTACVLQWALDIKYWWLVRNCKCTNLLYYWIDQTLYSASCLCKFCCLVSGHLTFDFYWFWGKIAPKPPGMSTYEIPTNLGDDDDNSSHTLSQVCVCSNVARKEGF